MHPATAPIINDMASTCDSSTLNTSLSYLTISINTKIRVAGVKMLNNADISPNTADAILDSRLTESLVKRCIVGYKLINP